LPYVENSAGLANKKGDRDMSAADIATTNRSFEDAVRRGDVEAIASLYESDAVVLPPDSPIVKGREAIRQLWMSAIKEHGLKSMRVESVELEIAGDIANEVGYGTLTMAPEGGKTETAEVKFLVIWKQSGGKWRLHRDVWNARSV
jgi:uncharacterized protein (TIGR02246 family)